MVDSDYGVFTVSLLCPVLRGASWLCQEQFLLSLAHRGGS